MDFGQSVALLFEGQIRSHLTTNFDYHFSMGLAIEKAKKNGVGWVTAKGSNHFGICQWYTEMAMKQGENTIKYFSS